MPKIINIVGERFGRLSIMERAENVKKRAAYLCACDCGNQKAIPMAYLRHGNVQSCGCLRSESSARTAKERKRPDARRDDPVYNRFKCMIQRCENPKNPHFKNYGKRGIAVCDRWRGSYESFLSDMGQPPTPNHTIERIDNAGPYSPDNCRWATRHEQLRNRRANILITIDGETMAAIDWAARVGVSYQKMTRVFRQHGITAVEAMIRTS